MKVEETTTEVVKSTPVQTTSTGSGVTTVSPTTSKVPVTTVETTSGGASHIKTWCSEVIHQNFACFWVCIKPVFPSFQVLWSINDRFMREVTCSFKILCYFFCSRWKDNDGCGCDHTRALSSRSRNRSRLVQCHWRCWAERLINERRKLSWAWPT